MKVQETLKKLESLGNPKRRDWNAKNGAGKNQFGVATGDIRALAKKIKTNHELALDLWKTGNIDAQLLAILLMQPKSLSIKELDRLVRSAKFMWVADWLNSYIVAQHPDKESLRLKWMNDKDPWAARAGWNLTASAVNKKDRTLNPKALLDRIEKEMPKAKPATQWTMNMTLGNIGIQHAEHRKRVIAIGEKIGLYKDWPVSKGCIPPYVPIWVKAVSK